MFKRKPKEFRRLPGRGLSLFTPSVLWAGPDHLVLVKRTGYTETYKRFYYADIQAIILQVNRHRLYWSLVFAVPLVMSMLWLLFADHTQTVAAGLMASIWGSFLLVNAARGPCCVFRVQTRINEERISMISRLRAGLKARRIIAERIEAVQGAVSREAVLAGDWTPPAPMAVPEPTLKKRVARMAIGPVSTSIHRILAIAISIQSILCFLLSIFSVWWLLLPNVVNQATIFVLGVIALARQSRGVMNPSLKFWGGAGFVFTLVQGMILFFYLFFKLIIAVQLQVTTRKFESMSNVMAGLFTHPFGFALMIVSAVAYLILAMTGVGLLLSRGAPASPSSPPPAPPA